MGEKEGDERSEVSEFGGEVRGSKGGAANGLTNNVEAGCVFSSGGEFGQGHS